MPQIGQGRNLFDDTPVNGQLEKGITSNWAFDENAALRALIEATLPWSIFIPPLPAPKSQVNWNYVTIVNAVIHNGYRWSSNAQNDSITWDIVLAKGTWSLELIHVTDVNAGIYSIQLDGVEVGTIDGYSNPQVNNVRTTVTGIVISITGKKELKFKMATKNTSSSGYTGILIAIQLTRTA